MLVMTYDLTFGFDNFQILMKNDQYDLAEHLETYNQMCSEEGLPGISELAFYRRYRNNIPELLETMKTNGWYDTWEDKTHFGYLVKYFSQVLGSGMPIACHSNIWEPHNIQLEYYQDQKPTLTFKLAYTGREACDMLDITKQQLHYYVSRGKIHKELDPKNPDKFKYNKVDVDLMFINLNAKRSKK